MSLKFAAIILLISYCYAAPAPDESCKGVRCLFGKGSNRCYVPMYNPSKPAEVQYLLNYNADKKIADWSLYFQPPTVKWTKAAESVRSFKEHQCNQLKGFQCLTPYYDELPKNPIPTGGGRHLALFQKGHLSPFAAFTFDQKQAVNTNFYINVVPQIGKINGGDWAGLEERSFKFIQDSTKGGYVVTGTTGAKDGMPEMVWKIVCASMPDGTVNAGYFAHNNTLPANFSDFENVMSQYKDGLRTLHSLTQFKKVMTDIDFDDIWDQAKAVYTADDQKNLADSCKKALTLPGPDGCIKFPTYLSDTPKDCKLAPFSE